jgi:hypothetical protein
MLRYFSRWRPVPSVQNSDDGIEMSGLTPRHVNDDESDNRSIKAGWYAMRRNGSLRLGPFSSRVECLAEIGQAKPEPPPRSYWAGVH